MPTVRDTVRETLKLGTVRDTLGGNGNGVPANALLDRQGNPIPARDGSYIPTRT